LISRNSKIPGLLGIALLAACTAHAGIVYTVSDDGVGGFTVSGVGAADDAPDFAASGATLPLDTDDVLIKIVNQSSSTLLDIFVTGNGSDPFGFDSSGAWGGSYVPPDGSVSLNPNAACGFCDTGDILFNNGGLAPGSSAFVSLEDDGNGVFANATLGVTDSAAAPEPASMALVGLGVAALAFMRRKHA
jgi:hypothetical protein